mgnify:CR=1 FL=1
MNYKKIRMYLVNKRILLRYSQYKVSKDAGISHQHYNMIENGVVGINLSVRSLCGIADSLGMSYQEICELEKRYQKEIIGN